ETNPGSVVSGTRPEPLHLSQSAMPAAMHFLQAYLPTPAQPSQIDAFLRRSETSSHHLPAALSGIMPARRFQEAAAVTGSKSLSRRRASAQRRRDWKATSAEIGSIARRRSIAVACGLVTRRASASRFT